MAFSSQGRPYHKSEKCDELWRTTQRFACDHPIKRRADLIIGWVNLLTPGKHRCGSTDHDYSFLSCRGDDISVTDSAVPAHVSIGSSAAVSRLRASVRFTPQS